MTPSRLQNDLFSSQLTAATLILPCKASATFSYADSQQRSAACEKFLNLLGLSFLQLAVSTLLGDVTFDSLSTPGGKVFGEDRPFGPKSVELLFVDVHDFSIDIWS
jgi:hypothetical protein